MIREAIDAVVNQGRRCHSERSARSVAVIHIAAKESGVGQTIARRIKREAHS